MTPPRPRYKIPESVLVVIHTGDRRVLLLERADRPGYWQSVTGSKDSEDEPLRETAVREVGEETGIVVAPGDALVDWHASMVYEIYPHWRHRYAPGVTANTEHWFSLCLPSEVSVTLHPREHLRYEWLGLEDAAARCFSPSNRAAILELPRRLGGACKS